MDLLVIQNSTCSPKRSLCKYGTRAPAVLVDGAMYSRRLGDSSKVRYKEIE